MLLVPSDQSNGSPFEGSCSGDVESKPDASGIQNTETYNLSEDTDFDEDHTSRRQSWGDKDLTERRKKAPKRVKQYLEYIKLMEDRVAAVEKQLRKLDLFSSASAQTAPKATIDCATQDEEAVPGNEAVPENETVPEKEAAPANEAVPEPNPPPPKQLKLRITHLKWDKFNDTRTSGQSIIEVLDGDVRLSQSFIPLLPLPADLRYLPVFLVLLISQGPY